MDFTVLPSIQEGLSMAALESMSCSKPVVITSTCGLSDYITNKKNGIIVPPTDSDSLASGIIDMINSDIAAMGKEARKLVETKFELNLVVNQYEKLLKTL
jgi:glycosyltransferase involved in cell wall biosynthesis